MLRWLTPCAGGCVWPCPKHFPTLKFSAFWLVHAYCPNFKGCKAGSECFIDLHKILLQPQTISESHCTAVLKVINCADLAPMSGTPSTPVPWTSPVQAMEAAFVSSNGTNDNLHPWWRPTRFLSDSAGSSMALEGRCGLQCHVPSGREIEGCLVAAAGVYKQEAIPRVPIVCTGNDFSTLYAPLIRDGRMEKYYWSPTREDRIGVCMGIFQHDGVDRSEVEHIVDSFPGQSIDFFGALRSRVYDDKVRVLSVFLWFPPAIGQVHDIWQNLEH